MMSDGNLPQSAFSYREVLEGNLEQVLLKILVLVDKVRPSGFVGFSLQYQINIME